MAHMTPVPGTVLVLPMRTILRKGFRARFFLIGPCYEMCVLAGRKSISCPQCPNAGTARVTLFVPRFQCLILWWSGILVKTTQVPPPTYTGSTKGPLVIPRFVCFILHLVYATEYSLGLSQRRLKYPF